jgi:hypothetical protein
MASGRLSALTARLTRLAELRVDGTTVRQYAMRTAQGIVLTLWMCVYMTDIHDYLSEIGRRGGQKSRRRLSSEEARAMAQRRWAKKRTEEESPNNSQQRQPDIGNDPA